MSEDKIELLKKRVKEILDESGCYYLVTIGMKTIDCPRNNFATFGKGPLMQLLTDTLTTLKEEDMSSDELPH